MVSQVIKENGLKNQIIAIHWSASGQVVRHFNKACSDLDLSVRFALAIEATPAMLVPSDRTGGLKKTYKNMVSLVDSHLGLFLAQLEEQGRLNGKRIMSKDDYLKSIFGDIPVGITGTDEFVENGSFVKDTGRAIEDKKFFAFDEYPLVAVISGDSALMPYHPIVDRGTWSFLITRKVYHDYFVGRLESGFKISERTLREFGSYVNKLTGRLSTTVHGNHFLFVGERSAKEVSECLESFNNMVMEIKEGIANFLK